MVKKMKKGYWFVHGRFGNEYTFVGTDKKKAIEIVKQMNKSRIHKGELIQAW